MSTENYNLQLPSEALAPKWLGPLRIVQIRGPNTVKVEVPPRLARIEPLQNVVHLKRYVEREPEVGPRAEPKDPIIVEGAPEFEVEDILAHRGKDNRIQYLTRFMGYGAEEDLWLPKRNLVNAPDIVRAYWERQNGRDVTSRRPAGQRAPRRLARLGHLYRG